VGLNDKDQLLRRKPGLRVTSDELIATLEALLIVAIDPSMNSRREKFRNAVRLFQADTAKRPEIEDRLESIEDKIEQLLAVREE
jgi:hypothetical protein